MSAELIIIIVGTVFLLVATVDSIKFKDASQNLVNSRVRIPLGISGVLLIIYGGYSYGSVNLPGQTEQIDVGNKVEIQYPVENVQVLSPVNGDAVKCRILTMGVYPEAHDKDIWVLLKPTDGKYYPQSDHTNTSFKRNGEWQVITRFGGDEGETYEVIVYEADIETSKFLSTTIENWKEADTYPGLELEDIPVGANLVDRLQVTLREHCRGVF